MRHTVAACIAFAAALLFPTCAFGAQPGYSIDKYDVSAYVETTSTVHIVEQKTITFHGENLGLIWYLSRPGPSDSVRVDSVRYAPVDDSGNVADDWSELVRIDSNPADQGTNPTDTASQSLRTFDVRPWYSYSILDGMMRAWFPANDTTVVLEIDYAILGPVRAWRDVGEFSWRYVHASSPVDQADVTLHVALPVPADSIVVPGSTVDAWGHGTKEGSVVVGEDGSITCHVDHVASGQYEECHAIFPVSWLTNLSLGSPQRHTEVRRAEIIAEEAEWLDVYARESIWDNKVRVLFCAIAALALIAGIIAVARFGRSEKTRTALLRLAATLCICAIAEQAYFKEPITTGILLGSAIVVGLAYLMSRGMMVNSCAVVECETEEGAEIDAEEQQPCEQSGKESPEEQHSADRDARGGEVDFGSSAGEDPEQGLC